jgi:hypothetical protein
MSVKWDVPKTAAYSNGRGPTFIRQTVSFYRRKYFIFCELRNEQFKQKLRFQGYCIQNITSLLFMT